MRRKMKFILKKYIHLYRLEGRTIVQRGDIYHLLGITAIRYPLFIDLREEDYLRFLGLENRTFITVQTGIDSIYKSFFDFGQRYGQSVVIW